MGLGIVIVDDAAFIREAIISVAEAEKFDVLGVAVDGGEAAKLVQEKNPDVIILDIMLPVKNGIEVAKEIIEQDPDARILACSTKSQKDMVLKALNAGCKDFLEKPFTANELVKKVRRIAEI